MQIGGGRKRRTREHVLADLSVNHVERQALLCGYSVQRWLHDYGIDLLLSTYTDAGEPDPGAILIQAKATDHLAINAKGQFISVRIERAHLRSWLIEPLPVLLIVYDGIGDRAYWLDIHAGFQGARRFQAVRGAERLTLRIPVGQVLDSAAVRSFRKLQEDALNRIQ